MRMGLVLQRSQQGVLVQKLRYIHKLMALMLIMVLVSYQVLYGILYHKQQVHIGMHSMEVQLKE